MNDQFHKDLASLKLAREASGISKLFALLFKLWFVWAFVCLAGAVGLICVAWHFVSKFW